MDNSLLSEDVLRRIGPTSLQRYATTHGWARQQLPERFQFALYRLPQSGKELVLPQTEDFGDYLPRIADFVIGLASAEGKSVRQILNEVLNPHSDVLKFGYQAPEARLGFVPFLTGISLFDAALRSISTATYDVVKPERFHLRMSNPTADAYIQSCRMGQTEVGSFVVPCICPVEPTSQIPVDVDDGTIVDETPAFGRQVTLRVLQAVTQIEEFIRADQSNRLVEPAQGDLVISGNFLDSLMAFPVEHEAASLYISASWDKTVTQPTGPDRVEVRYDMFEAIEDVARQLRPAKTTREDKFIAKVITLRGEPNPNEQMEGEVVLLLFHQEAGVRARVWLTADDYALAGQAHMQNGYVSVTGVLAKSRKTFQIEKYTNFAILAD
jgi:hypothetical protein